MSVIGEYASDDECQVCRRVSMRHVCQDGRRGEEECMGGSQAGKRGIWMLRALRNCIMVILQLLSYRFPTAKRLDMVM